MMTATGGAQFATLMRAANAALDAKDAARALQLLADAERLEPKNPDLHYNRAFALKLANDFAASLKSLDAALACEPYHLPAMLSKGEMLANGGLKRDAAMVFRNALAFAPPPERLPPQLAESLRRASALVAEDNAAQRDFFEHEVASLKQKYGRSELKRFDECLSIFTGFGRAYFPQPTMLHFPALPPVCYFDRALFPWLEEYEAATPAIQEDLESLLASPASEEFSPYIDYPPGAPINQWGELNKSRRWSSYFFWKDGTRNESAFERAPRTGAAIDKLPLFDAPEFGPAAFFSSLAAHSHIPPHVGSSNVRSIVHLPLILPGRAWFRVGNERRDWKIGEAWVFDDSIDHEAMNEADLTRTILIVDVWNPYLTEPERELVSALLPLSRAYKRGARPA